MRDRPPPEDRALILTLQAEATELPAIANEQQRHIEALRQRLSQNSTNFSRPPSSDPPTVKRCIQAFGRDQQRRCGGIAHVRFCETRPAP
jgi:hypothetical protein